MSRPRRITAKYCYECSTDAVHRFEHRRADAQRAKWRAAKERKRQREHGAVVGYLHNLSCAGGHYQALNGCTPIPLRRQLRSVA